MPSSQWSLIGAGEIFMGPRSGGLLRSVGQTKEFKLEVKDETKEMRDYVNGGGTADSVTVIDKVEATFQFQSLSAKNLALALRGATADEASSVVTNQLHTAYAGGLIPVDGIGPTTVSIAVSPPPWVAGAVRVAGDLIKPTIGTHFYRCKSSGTSAAANEPTWKTDGTDTTDGSAVWQDMGLMILIAGEFQINSAGIFIPETSTKIAATGTPVSIGYTTTASTVVQTLVASAGEYRVLFAGKNMARGGKPMKVELFRTKFGVPKDISFLGDDFASLTLSANVLKDDTRLGEDISAYCTISMAEE
ncbi:MAG: hypothetical protein H7834_09995 [Magnetococcus sp. YQC-9]